MNDPSLIRLSGIVERVTFHNIENGWSILKVSPFAEPEKLATVVIHQAKVFAGSSMDFWGHWSHHPKYGEQFKAEKAVEKKPASSAALEKYLGSGLIKGVGPITASKIVKFFQDKTLTVFEESIDELLRVPGIAEKKLLDIKNSWQEHKSIRDVMLFLQGHGISTLFAVKIYKTYGDRAVQIVSNNPYQLAKDIYGIGFFSADKIALSLGFDHEGPSRIEAGILHVLAGSREEGHCYLTEEQILSNSSELLQIRDAEKLKQVLYSLERADAIKRRILRIDNSLDMVAYYSKSLFFDELYVAKKIKKWIPIKIEVDSARVQAWVVKYCEKFQISLSDEQLRAVVSIPTKAFSILTGGPGCGKTTTTKVLVKLLQAMNKKVILAAPTGRAAQRMSEVIGQQAKTLHRLLEWTPGLNGFKRNEQDPLDLDFLIIDESSMLDIQLAAALLKAVTPTAQVLFIGDPDQLPSVGAGNVLYDLLQVDNISSFKLTKVFRQAEESLIIRYAHQINKGQVPKIHSPFYNPKLWHERAGCLFIDAEEATKEQLQFLNKAKYFINKSRQEAVEIQVEDSEPALMTNHNDLMIEPLLFQEFSSKEEVYRPLFVIPEKFRHVDLHRLSESEDYVQELKTILKSVHPWSSLKYGMTAMDTILRLYTKTIPEFFGSHAEIQVLTPQVRGSLGTLNLNESLQRTVNPEDENKKQIKIGEKIFRQGDRVIQTRNNYDLGVFNGDIGYINSISLETYTCQIQFGKQLVDYAREDLTEISLAYSITIHKSQGSEFDCVIIPVSNQHFKMLFRNLIYTGLTRAKKLCVFVGNRKALSLAVRQVDNHHRQTALSQEIEA